MIEEPLTFKRTVLIETLEGQLAARQKEHDEKQEEMVKAKERSVEFLHDLVERHPGLILAQLVSLRDVIAAAKDEDDLFEKLYVKYGSREAVEKYDQGVKAQPYPGHPVLDKWIRLLKLADNTTIEITPEDEIYPIL